MIREPRIGYWIAIAVALLVLICCVPMVSAENLTTGANLANLTANSTISPEEPFIAIDSIGNHTTGEVFSLNGTTPTVMQSTDIQSPSQEDSDDGTDQIAKNLTDSRKELADTAYDLETHNPVYEYIPGLKLSDTASRASSVRKPAVQQAGSPQSAIIWQKSLGGSNLEFDDLTGIVRQTSDGGYIATVTTESTDGDVTGNHGILDFWVVKLDSAGGIQWKKCLGGSDSDSPHSIRQTSDGGYIVAGVTKSTDGNVYGLHHYPGQDPLKGDFWVVKLSATGSVQWQRCLGGNNWDEAYDIHEVPGGGFIVAGYTLSPNDNGDVSGNHGGSDAWVARLDSNGMIVWARCLGGTGGDSAHDVQPVTDGGFIVAGFTASADGDVTGNHGGGDAWIVKLDSAGIIQWQRCYGGSAGDNAFRVRQTSDGGYIFTGSAASTDGDVTGNHGGDDAWVVKLDSAGTIQWQKALGGSAGDYGFDIQQIPDGGYVVASRTESNNGDVSGNHGGTDIWVVKLDNSGTIQWYLTLGGSGWEIPGSIEQTTNGNYILGGISFSTDGDVVGNHGGLYDLWVVKHGEGVPVGQPELVVDVKDVGTSVLIPNASIGLYDFIHSEWQNVTAANGTIVFKGSGMSHQYPLVIGNTYRLAAEAGGYSPVTRNMTFVQDGQRETMNLTKVEQTLKLIVDIKDNETEEFVLNASVRLHDFDHGENQDAVAPNGTVIFNSSGTTHQYSLIIGSTYGFAVSAQGYNGLNRNVTFIQDGQRETMNMTKPTPPPPPSSYTFSITNVEKYPGNRSLAPFGTSAAWNVYYYLNHTAGWQLNFWKNDTEVTEEDFGTQGGGLNEATFHFHFSHGGHEPLLSGNPTLLELLNGVIVHPLQVQKKWGKNNKWVMLAACEILDDPTWGGALNTSHGIFGYKTEVSTHSVNFMLNDFFENAMNQKKTLLESYRNATKYGTYYSDIKNVRAAVIFHNEQQANRDHLPGYGTVEPDGNMNDKPWGTNWSCSEA